MRSRSGSRRGRRSFWPRSSLPLRTHLRQAVHVDGGPLPFLFGRQLLQQFDGASQIALDRCLGGGVVQLLDLGDRVHGERLRCPGCPRCPGAQGARVPKVPGVPKVLGCPSAPGARVSGFPKIEICEICVICGLRTSAFDRAPERCQRLRVQHVLSCGPGAAGDQHAPLRELQLVGGMGVRGDEQPDAAVASQPGVAV